MNSTIVELGLQLRLGRLLNRYLRRRELGPPPHGLGEVQAVTLALMEEATSLNVWLNQKQLARKIGSPKEYISTILKKLERGGLCKVIPRTNSRRGKYPRITVKGKRVLRQWMYWYSADVELAEMPGDPRERRGQETRLGEQLQEQLRFLKQRLAERIRQ